MDEVGDTEIEALTRDTCPDCGHLGLDGGPRGGAGQNVFCGKCGSGFNIALPRFVMMAQRIGKR
jgi:ribosomal protein S27AE